MSTKYVEPAFPSIEVNLQAGECQNFGMSLRDYFAAKAMQGICAHHDTWGEQIEGIAVQAYRIADAMLAERSKS